MNHMPVYTQTLDLARKGLNIILPPRCPVTGESVDNQGMLSGRAWRSLNFIAAPFCNRCGMPFSFDRQGETQSREESAELCMGCLEKAPPYDSARAALIYDETSRVLILGFKHGDKIHMVQNFAPWLQSAGREFLSRAEVFIPVPLHYSRLIARRYNQAVILAKGLEKITGINAIPDALIRTRATPSQGRLSFNERRKNVRKAFSLRENYKTKIKGKTLVLIDDVYTTGATVKECTKVLKSEGAKAVHVLTIARVAREDF